MSRRDARGFAVLIPLLFLPALACGPRLTPEEKIELMRSQYTAELESLTVKQDPVEAAAPGGGTPVSADAAVPDVRTDVILDILVSTTAQKYLPGVTLDVQHVDGNRREKDRRLLWVDTSTLARGGSIEVTHVLENVDWQAGDGFAVEVRAPVPAAERGEYREFQGD